MTGEPWPAFPSANRLMAEVDERLFARRQVMVHGPLDGERATRVAALLMALEAEGDEPIDLWVSSDGGDLWALFAVTDTVAAMRARVSTRCLGRAEGTAVALVAAGTGRRTAAPHATMRLCLPRTEVTGSATDIAAEADAQSAACARLYDLVARAGRRPRQVVAGDWERGVVLSAGEAAAYGLVDEVGG